MSRLKIEDLPKDYNLDKDEIQKVLGSGTTKILLAASETQYSPTVAASPNICIVPVSPIASPQPYPNIATTESNTKDAPRTKGE